MSLLYEKLTALLQPITQTYQQAERKWDKFVITTFFITWILSLIPVWFLFLHDYFLTGFMSFNLGVMITSVISSKFKDKKVLQYVNDNGMVEKKDALKAFLQHFEKDIIIFLNDITKNSIENSHSKKFFERVQLAFIEKDYDKITDYLLEDLQVVYSSYLNTIDNEKGEKIKRNKIEKYQQNLGIIDNNYTNEEKLKYANML